MEETLIEGLEEGFDARVPKIEDGEYTLRIEECRTFKGFYGQTFVVECTVLSTTEPEYMGARVARVFCPITSKPKVDELRKLLTAAQGHDPENRLLVNKYATKETLVSAVGSDQPFAGLTVHGVVESAKSKTGNTYTKGTWTVAE